MYHIYTKHSPAKQNFVRSRSTDSSSVVLSIPCLAGFPAEYSHSKVELLRPRGAAHIYGGSLKIDILKHTASRRRTRMKDWLG